MTISEIADKVYRATLKKKQLTAGEIADRMSIEISGRGIARPLGVLVEEGALRYHQGRRPTYTKVA